MPDGTGWRPWSSILPSVISPRSLFRKHHYDLWLLHCPIGYGDFETSPVARQKMSDQVEVIEKVKPLQENKNGGWVWREKGKAAQSRLEEVFSVVKFYLYLRSSCHFWKENRESRWLKLLIIKSLSSHNLSLTRKAYRIPYPGRGRFSGPGIEPMPPAVEEWSLSHWTSGKSSLPILVPTSAFSGKQGTLVRISWWESPEVTFPRDDIYLLISLGSVA